MIDSFSAYSFLSNFETNKITNNLTNVREEVVKDTGEIRFRATVNNKTINLLINGNKVSISGSLSQYYKENFTSLTWDELIPAINKLERELDIELDNFIITSIDLESTFPVYYEPKSYFNFLGDSPYYTRFIEKNTLYYNSGNRKIRVYDKSKKVKKDLKVLSNNTLNYLRFETSFRNAYLNQIEKTIEIDQITIKHLYNPVFQKYLLDLWLKEYKQIHKIPKLKFELNEIKGLGDLKNKLIISKINDLGGLHQVLEMINNSSNTELDSKTKYKIKTGISELVGSPLNILQSTHLNELNTCISISYINNYLSIR